MGNTLDRPQLLLNRYKVRDTTFDQEVVNTGDQYQFEEEAKVRMETQHRANLRSNLAPVMQQQVQGRVQHMSRANMVSLTRTEVAQD